MSDQIIVSSEDVVSMAQAANFARASTSTGEELMARLKEMLRNAGGLSQENISSWLEDGVDCKFMLAQGGGWQKGRIRIRVEFVHDEPLTSALASPLDDLRSQLDTQ